MAYRNMLILTLLLFRRRFILYYIVVYSTGLLQGRQPRRTLDLSHQIFSWRRACSICPHSRPRF